MLTKIFKPDGILLLQQQQQQQQKKTTASQQQQTTASRKATAAEARFIEFTAKELKLATKNYSNDRIIRVQSFGTIYRGVLPSGNNRAVAIMQCQCPVKTETAIEQFINEIVTLSQASHENVVNIIGICLETAAPLLVYEFFPYRTLYDHILPEGRLSWETLLRIAAETAGALAHFQSSFSLPILHGDVNSANIFIDEYHTAKVFGLGVSRLFRPDPDISQLVVGKIGYLDPQYLQTEKLTDKSDVYSFGVVLAELLTGKPAMLREEDNKYLATYFLQHMEYNRLFEVVEPQVWSEESRQQVEAVARLAVRCLMLELVERPTMKEVAAELEGLRRQGDYQWDSGDHGDEESVRLLDGSITTAGDESLDGPPILSMREESVGLLDGSTTAAGDGRLDVPLILPSLERQREESVSLLDGSTDGAAGDESSDTSPILPSSEKQRVLAEVAKLTRRAEKAEKHNEDLNMRIYAQERKIEELQVWQTNMADMATKWEAFMSKFKAILDGI